MIRKFTLLLLACLGVVSLSIAQPLCGFDQKHQQRLASDPVYAAAVAQENAWLAANQALLNNALPVTLPNGKFAHELPVVVHVMYTTEKPQYNVSLTQVQNLITYLNNSFQATYAGYPDTNSGGTRIPIVFKLAARTPTCGPTTGVNYVNLTSNPTFYQYGMAHNTANGVPEGTLKAMSMWPRDQYINIWIISRMDGADGLTPGPFTAGFAWLPPGPANLDGIVMLASVANPGQITLPHEMGHYFNLQHVFNGGSTTTCPPNANCNAQGDFVCDTEPQRQSSFDCPSTPTPSNPIPINPCTLLPYQNGPNNFMDYSDCQNRFTPGQRTRMMLTVAGTRGYLLASLGAVPPNATSLPTVCVPTMPSPPIPPATSFFGPRDIEISRGTLKIFDVTSSGYSGDGNQHYIDNTCKARAELEAGVLHDMNLTFAGSSKVRVYIDYNNDGDFLDANETIYSADNAGSPETPSFTPPVTGAVYCIPLRMRVIVDNNVAGALGPCSSLNQGQTEDYEVIIRGATNNNLTGLVTLSIPASQGNPSCAGTHVDVMTNVSTSITPVWYKWFKTNGTLVNGPSSGTATSWGQTSWITNDSVYVKVAYVGLCGIDTAISDTIILNRPPTILPSVTIGVTAGSNPTCIDETVTLSMTGNVNPGANATFQWYRNGNPITGAINSSYNVLGGTSGDVYHLRMILATQNTCNGLTQFVNSNTISVTHTTKPPTANIALTTGTNPGCAGQLLTFTATGTVLGTTPTYQWLVNGLAAGTNSPTFTSIFNNNDVVSVVITSSSLCASTPTATSTGVTIVQQLITADITINQVSGGNPACSGHPVIFSATPVNSGPNPQFQWLINNNPVTGANSPVFNTTSLVNGDVVKCILISSDPCVVNTLDTSNAIQMNVTPSKVPKITFTLTKGNNPGCLDSLVEFTATATDAGTNPAFEWFVNNFPLNLNNDVYSSTNLLNNDVVTARIVPTDGQCYLPDTGFSAPVTMVRSPTPEPPVISLIHNMLITNKSGSFVWFGPGGQLTGGDDGKYHPGELGQYYAVTNNNGCWSKPSNKLTITLLDINTLNTQPANIYPNPTTGKLTIDWGRNVNSSVAVFSTVGQKLMEEKVVNASSKVLDLGTFAGGIYFVVITDENGGSSTTRITLTR